MHFLENSKHFIQLTKTTLIENKILQNFFFQDEHRKHKTEHKTVLANKIALYLNTALRMAHICDGNHIKNCQFQMSEAALMLNLHCFGCPVCIT